MFDVECWELPVHGKKARLSWIAPLRRPLPTRSSRGEVGEPPVRVAVIGHRLVDQREEFRVVFLQGFARLDRMCGVAGRGLLSEGVEVGEHALRPIRHTVMDGGGAFPFPGAVSRLVKFLQLLVELNVQSLDPQFILLHLAAPDRKSTRLNSSHCYTSYAAF